MKENKEYMEQEAMQMNELSEEELAEVSGGGFWLGVALIGGGIAFGYGAFKGLTSGCRKK